MSLYEGAVKKPIMTSLCFPGLLIKNSAVSFSPLLKESNILFTTGRISLGWQF